MWMGRQTRKAKALLMLPPNNIHNNNNWVKKIEILIKLNALKVKNKDMDNIITKLDKKHL